MRSIQIDLTQPFEEVLATVLLLPAGSNKAGGNRLVGDVELKQVIRGLHEAANGRQVQARSGLLAIAPPIAAFLKKEPFQVATQVEFLIAAATRILCSPPRSEIEMQIVKDSNPDGTTVVRRDRVSTPSSQASGTRPHNGAVTRSVNLKRKTVYAMAPSPRIGGA